MQHPLYGVPPLELLDWASGLAGDEFLAAVDELAKRACFSPPIPEPPGAPELIFCPHGLRTLTLEEWLPDFFALVARHFLLYRRPIAQHRLAALERLLFYIVSPIPRRLARKGKNAATLRGADAVICTMLGVEPRPYKSLRDFGRGRNAPRQRADWPLWALEQRRQAWVAGEPLPPLQRLWERWCDESFGEASARARRDLARYSPEPLARLRRLLRQAGIEIPY